MKRTAALMTVLMALLPAWVKVFPDEGRSIASYTYYILVDNTQNAIKDLRAFAPAKNGYVSYFSNDRVVLRIPSGDMDSVKRKLAETGYVTDERQTRQDFSQVMLDLETRLGVKQKLLSDLNALFSGAKLADTLRVEQEIGKVIVEIEDLKGKIGYYKNRFALSDVTVFVNKSTDSGGTMQTAPSQWNWVRSLGIEGLMRD